MTTTSQLARLGLFDARVPRYTSYPTAPHFAGGVTAGTVGDWISALPTGVRLSLYVHIPFCRRLCWFCACRTQGTATAAPVAAYLDVVKAELAQIADRLPPGAILSQLHWGGGTPTLLDAAMMTDLAETIRAAIPFAPDCEFSVEIDPNEVDDARLDALAAAGLTRASIGVQDFDPHIQKIIGREQSFELTQRVVDAIRVRGITSLNTDILFGLPDQTPARMTDSVQKLLSLSPDRVALYGYAHVPWMARRQTLIPSEALPRPEERLHLFEIARKLFLWDGYDEIGIDHFARKGDGMAVAARKGTLRRNFQGYTVDDGEALIGIGASAISRYPQGYAQNASGTGDYTRKIRDGELAIHRGHAFTQADLVRGRMIEALMCDFRVDRSALVAEFDGAADLVDGLFRDSAMQFDGFVEITNGNFIVRPEGRALTRMIARSFDAYAMDEAGHSPAI